MRSAGHDEAIIEMEAGSVNMERIFEYQLKQADLEDTNGGRVIWILRRRIGLTAHEFRHAKYTENGICMRYPDGNEHKVILSDQLRPGDTLVVRLSDSDQSLEEQDLVPAKGELDILYEDDDVIVLNKPAGTVVHPSHGHYADSIANYLAWYYKEKDLQVITRAVGRLDKETSGALLFAKNRAAAGRLFEQRKKGILRRRYIALAEGSFSEKTGTIDRPIGPSPDSIAIRMVCPDGQDAFTQYEVLKKIVLEGRTCSLLGVEIRTGRTHQIRVHMESIGHPLCGDTLYGRAPAAALQGQAADRQHEAVAPQAPAAPGLHRAMLHAAGLWFQQPFTKEPIHVTAPFPEDFRSIRGLLDGE